MFLKLPWFPIVSSWYFLSFSQGFSRIFPWFSKGFFNRPRPREGPVAGVGGPGEPRRNGLRRGTARQPSRGGGALGVGFCGDMVYITGVGIDVPFWGF